MLLSTEITGERHPASLLIIKMRELQLHGIPPVNEKVKIISASSDLIVGQKYINLLILRGGGKNVSY